MATWIFRVASSFFATFFSAVVGDITKVVVAHLLAPALDVDDRAAIRRLHFHDAADGTFADGALRLMGHRSEWNVHAPTKREQRSLSWHDFNVDGFGYEWTVPVNGMDDAPPTKAAKEDAVEVFPRDRREHDVGLQCTDQLVPKWRAATYQ